MGPRSGRAEGLVLLLLLLRRAAGVRKAASVLRMKQRREDLRNRTESEGVGRAGEAAAGGDTAGCFRTQPQQQQKKTTSRTSCACKAERRVSLNRVLLLLLLLSPSSVVRMAWSPRREVQQPLRRLRTGTW